MADKKVNLKKLKPKIKSKKSKKSRGFKTILWALVFLFLIDFFLFETVVITDSRMENSLFPGDVVIVNEYSYGKRLPITVLTLPFFREYLPFSQIPSFLSLIELSYYRFFAFSEIEHGDLMAFNYPGDYDKPIDKKSVVIKRVVGLPGDTIVISDKKIFKNNKMFNEPTSLKYRYRIVGKSSLTFDFLTENKLFEGSMVFEPNVYDFYINESLADSLRNDTSIKNVNIMKIPRGTETTFFFPQNGNFLWNPDYFGPLVVPKKDETVNVTVKNVALYKQIIMEYEENELFVNNTEVTINGKPADSYTFKQNYYFVLDDNRDNAKDSRVWGFVPESHVLGKASFVLLSVDKGHNSWWSRFFKIPE